MFENHIFFLCICWRAVCLCVSLLFPSINWLAISWPISLWGGFGIYLIDFQELFCIRISAVCDMNCKYLVTGLLSLLSVVIALLWFLSFYEEKICIMQEGLYGPHSWQNREQNEFLNILSTMYRSACIGQAYKLGSRKRRKEEKSHFLILHRQIPGPGQSISWIQGRCGFNGWVLSPHSLPFYSAAIKQSVGGQPNYLHHKVSVWLLWF